MVYQIILFHSKFPLYYASIYRILYQRLMFYSELELIQISKREIYVLPKKSKTMFLMTQNFSSILPKFVCFYPNLLLIPKVYISFTIYLSCIILI